MTTLQPDTHSFIVKVWLEDANAAQTAGKVKWRGRITHVPSGLSCHFDDVAEIAAFVQPYLHQMGLRPTWRWRMWQRLRRSRCADANSDMNK